MNFKLHNLIFVFALFSIHLIPFADSFSFETLPILLIIFCIFIFLLIDRNLLGYINNEKLIFYLIAFTIILFFKDLLLGKANIVELIKYLVGPVIYLFYRNLKKFLDINELIIFGISIFVLYLIFKFQPTPIFNFTCNYLEFFISRYQCDNTFNVTIKLLRPFLITPEPSYLSLMLSFYLILLFSLKIKVINNKKKLFIVILEILICFLIISTYSRVGLLFVFIYFLYYVNFLIKDFNFKIKKYVVPIILSSLIIMFYLNFKSNIFNDKLLNINSRNVLNIDKIFSSLDGDSNKDFLISGNKYKTTNDVLALISNKEPTGFIRILHNYISIKQSFKNNLIGYGIGSYPLIWYEHVIDLDLKYILKTNEVMANWNENKKQYVQNYFFSTLHDGGIFTSIFILLLLFKTLKKIIISKNKFNYVIFSYVIMTLFFQSPISSPYPWLALAIINFSNTKNA
mgnify:CR=1 FL=1